MYIIMQRSHRFIFSSHCKIDGNNYFPINGKSYVNLSVFFLLFFIISSGDDSGHVRQTMFQDETLSRYNKIVIYVEKIISVHIIRNT